MGEHEDKPNIEFVHGQDGSFCSVQRTDDGRLVNVSVITQAEWVFPATRWQRICAGEIDPNDRGD